MARTLIHVSMHLIRARDPNPIYIETQNSIQTANRVYLSGPTWVVTDYTEREPHKAVVYLVTDSPVSYDRV